jgi:translation initiation factor 5A
MTETKEVFTECDSYQGIIKGQYIMIGLCACKIDYIAISNSKSQSKLKIHIIGIDIFTNNKHEIIMPTYHLKIKVPIVNHHTYILASLSDDDYLSLLDEHTGEVPEDIQLPKGTLGTQIKEHYNKGNVMKVDVVHAIGIDQILKFNLVKDMY